MRYDPRTDPMTGLPHLVPMNYLESQLQTQKLTIDVDDEGFKLRRENFNGDNHTLIAISNEGFVVVNVAYAGAWHKVSSTFCRELLGKNMLIVWRRGKTRILVYPEGERWNSENTERWTAEKDVVIFDLRLKPLSGVKKMAPLRKRDPNSPTREYIRKTTSEW